MKKTVQVNGEKVKVDFSYIYAKHEVLHKIITKKKDGELFDCLSRDVISLNGKEITILVHNTQMNGNSKTLYQYNNVWHPSEKKLIEAILN
jgi:hypothetical protein